MLLNDTIRRPGTPGRNLLAQSQPRAPGMLATSGMIGSIGSGGWLGGGAQAPSTFARGQYAAPGIGFQANPNVFRNYKNQIATAGNFTLNNALAAGPGFWDEVNRLTGQANQSHMDPSLQAAFLAPRQEAINTQFNQAGDRLRHHLLDSGIDQSSGAVNAYGQLEGQRAQTQSNLISNLYQTEDDRQRQSQGQLRALLASLLGGAPQAAGLAQQSWQNVNASDQGGGLFGDVLNGVFGLGGAYLGGRGRPSGGR